MPGFAGFGPTFAGGFVHHGGGRRVRGGGGGFVHHGGGMMVGHGPVMYGPPIGYGFHGGRRSMDFYSGWFGFHEEWAECMDWMEHEDYLVWHGWQQMLSSSTISRIQQRSLLEGMLLQQHGGMSFEELNQLTDRILQMNKQLGAGDDGRVSEVTETTTTTTTTTTSSNITQQQRYDTANDFLQLLTSSGGMGFSLEQAQQRANEIRQGKQDNFVQTHLESQAAKANASQHTLQAPPQQMQTQTPLPTPQAITQPPVSHAQQQTLSPQPQGQYSMAHNQHNSQQTMLSLPQQMPVYSPAAHVQPQTQQLHAMQQNLQAVQSPAPQMQRYMPYSHAQGNMATSSTTTTMTTTSDAMTSGMHGMSLRAANQPRLPSPATQQQYGPQQTQYQVESPSPQYQSGMQQHQAMYPSSAGQRTQQVAVFNQLQPNYAMQMQTPAPSATFNQQPQSPYAMQNHNYQQPQLLQQQQQQQAPQQLPMQASQHMPQQQSQLQQYAPTPTQLIVQQQSAQQARPLLHHERYR